MKKLFSLIAMFCVVFATPAAHAVDACKVTLCIAGDWRHIGTCVPPVEEVLRDMALGRSWPTCAMASASTGTTGTSALNATSESLTEDTCPPMFQEFRTVDMEQIYSGCRYTGAVSVSIAGAAWSTLYWNASGDSIISYSATAEAQLGAGNYDTTYDTELAEWVASHPGGGIGGGGCVPRPDARCPEPR